MSEGGKEVVERGLRTVIAGVPVVGGILAQAWSEYEGHVQSERLNEFFGDFAKRCQELEERILEVKEHVKSSGEFPALWERVIYKVERETSKKKRRMYAEALAKGMAAGHEISFDQKLTVIDTLDALTETDIEVLAHFGHGHRILVSQLLPSGAPSNQLAEFLGRLIPSISKLESRGLLTPSSTANVIYPVEEGYSGYWVNRWQRKMFEITPFGKTFVELIEAKTDTQTDLSH